MLQSHDINRPNLRQRGDTRATPRLRATDAEYHPLRPMQRWHMDLGRMHREGRQIMSATYKIKYADGTRDIQTVANKTQLRFDKRNGRPTKVESVKRIALQEAK